MSFSWQRTLTGDQKLHKIDKYLGVLLDQSKVFHEWHMSCSLEFLGSRNDRDMWNIVRSKTYVRKQMWRREVFSRPC